MQRGNRRYATVLLYDDKIISWWVKEINDTSQRNQRTEDKQASTLDQLNEDEKKEVKELEQRVTNNIEFKQQKFAAKTFENTASAWEDITRWFKQWEIHGSLQGVPPYGYVGRNARRPQRAAASTTTSSPGEDKKTSELRNKIKKTLTIDR